MLRFRLAAVFAFSVLAASQASARVTTSDAMDTFSPASPTSTFTIDFPFTSLDQLVVTLITEATEAEVTLTRGTHYRARLPVGSVKGYITMVSPSSVTSTHTLTVERVVPFTQNISFSTQGSYSAALHEAAFDKLTMLAQQITSAGGSDGEDAVETHVALADPHTQYQLLAGRSGGQSATGGTDSGDDLWLKSTSHGTKGSILMGSAGTELVIDDVNNRVGIGTATPTVGLDATGVTSIIGGLKLDVSGAFNRILNTANDDIVVISGSTGMVGTNAAGFSIFGSADATLPNQIFAFSSKFSFTDEDGNGFFTLDGTDGLLVYQDITVDPANELYADTIVGNNASSGNLAITSNTDSDGLVTIEATVTVDGATDRVGIGDTTPDVALDVVGASIFSGAISGLRSSIAGGASYTLTAPDECGGVIMTSTDNAIITLPNAAAANDRCTVTVINTGADGAALISIQPHSTDGIYGSCVGITGAGAATVVQFSGTNNKAINNTKATANKGDTATLVSDGTGGWYVTSCVGEWASTP